MGPARSRVREPGDAPWACATRTQPWGQVGVSCLVEGGHCWVGSRELQQALGTSRADHGPRDPQGSAVLFPLCPLPGPAQGPRKGQDGPAATVAVMKRQRHCDWGGEQTPARDTRKAWTLGANPGLWLLPTLGAPGGGGQAHSPTEGPQLPGSPSPCCSQSRRVVRGQEGSAPRWGRRLLTESAQWESWELCSIWGKMETAVQEIALQTESLHRKGGEGQCKPDSGEGGM